MEGWRQDAIGPNDGDCTSNVFLSFFVGYGSFGQDAGTFHLGSTWPNAFVSQWGQSITGGVLTLPD